jgi:DNA-binding CsgD family transcriptional regulator
MGQRGRPPYPETLTPRQQEVLELLREGLTNREIGQRLDISTDGAKFHVSEILTRIGVTSREDAVRWAEAPAERATASLHSADRVCHSARVSRWPSGVARTRLGCVPHMYSRGRLCPSHRMHIRKLVAA